MGLIGGFLRRGKGVDEGWVCVVAADGYGEGDGGGVGGDVLAGCQGVWDRGGGVFVFRLGDGTEASEGCEAHFAVDGEAGDAGDGAGVEYTG